MSFMDTLMLPIYIYIQSTSDWTTGLFMLWAYSKITED